MDGAAVVARMMADLEQKREGKLRHALRAVGRDVAHRDAAALCRFHVHDIVARGEHADVAHRRAGGKHAFRDHRLVRQHDRRAADAPDCLLFAAERAIVHRQLAKLSERIPAQIARILRVSVQHNNFHVSQPPVPSRRSIRRGTGRPDSGALRALRLRELFLE